MVSCPATRKVMHCATMFSSGSVVAALLVDAGEHPAQQVGVVGGVAAPTPVRHQPLDQVDHELLVLA